MGRRGEWGFLALYLVVCCICTSMAATSRSADVLAWDVAAKNKSTVEAIQTLKCSYSTKKLGPDGKITHSTPEIHYVRLGTSFRAAWRDSTGWRETVVDEFQVKSTGASAKQDGKRITAVLPYTGLPLAAGDPWTDAQLGFTAPWKKNPTPVFFAELLEYPGTKIESTQEDQLVVVRLESSTGNSVGRYWFDPRKNHLITKTEVLLKGGKAPDSSVTIEIEKFVEAAAGVYFPARYTRTDQTGGKTTAQWVTEIRGIQINIPLAPDSLDLPAKPNDVVIDHIQGRQFVVGSDGRSETNTRSIEPLVPMRNKSTPTQLTETKAENRTFPIWVLPLSFACIIIPIFIRQLRKWRPSDGQITDRGVQ